MKVHNIAAVSVMAGLLAGGSLTHSLHAQVKPPVYLIGEIDISDPEAYRTDYLPAAQASIKSHGGKAVAGGIPIQLVGEPPKTRAAIYAWDSIEQLKGWIDSPEYKAIRSRGEKYAKYRNFAVPGVAQ